jgi:DNA-binding NtrC family response regulator
VLIVDDNVDLLRFVKHALGDSPRWEITTAETAEAALAICSRHRPAVALIDYMLPGVNGLELSSQLQGKIRSLQIIIMTGGRLSPDEQEVCRTNRWLLLQKPFMTEDVIALLQARLAMSAAASR